MPKLRIYVDTTIPSAYYTRRSDPKMVAWRNVTRKWWEIAVRSCELVTSPAVLREAARGRPVQVSERLNLLKDLILLHPDEEIESTAALYVHHKLMPRDVKGDALHLALASHFECDVLVTWNYHHLANPNKLDRIRRFNEELGLSVPRLLTPPDLIGGHS